MRMNDAMNIDETTVTQEELGDEGKNSGLKFGLNTAASLKRKHLLSKPVQPADDAPVGEAVSSVEGGVVKGDAKPAEPLVIPLLDSNGKLDQSALQAAAVHALLSGDDRSTATASTADGAPEVVVPMLLKNRLDGIEHISDDDEKFRFDIDKRPDAPTSETYERMPVEMIGEAMLRGMGWTPGGGVGKDRRVFDPIEYIPRPGRIGLGAKIDDYLPPTHAKKRGGAGDAGKEEDDNRRRPIKQGESRDGPKLLGARNDDGSFKSTRSLDEKLVELKRREVESGASVGIVSGRHAGMHGRVEQLLPDNKASVRLTSDAVVTVARNHLALLDGAGGEARKRKKSSKSGGSAGPAAKKRRDVAVWLRPNIMVRIVSKSFRDGRFYSQKARVVDCVGGEECVVELADGRVIEGVRQSMLENVVGRDTQSVLVLRGAHSGAFGKVLRRDAKSQSVLVQLDDLGTAQQFAYDDVALYVGRDNV